MFIALLFDRQKGKEVGPEKQSEIFGFGNNTTIPISKYSTSVEFALRKTDGEGL